ncbi:MAG TPA: TonB family protein, partial [Gemmatimonadaceae bacterium]|nr:TonB family protein [Gemmatimonadaceae bacterium]
MMTMLLESGARPYGSKKGVALSVGLHGLLIGAAIAATAAAASMPKYEKIEEHPVVYVAPPPPAAEPVHVAPPPPAAKAPKAATVPAVKRVETPRPKPAQAQPLPKAPAAIAIAAPTRVPVSIPAIDLKTPDIGDIVAAPAPDRIATGGSSRRTSAESGGEVEESSGRGLNSGSAARAYSENEVERTVEVVRAPEPRYPDALRSADLEGAVMMQFIVGTNGRVEPGSIKVLSSPHKQFSDAVRAALLSAKFRPAQAGGHAVR